MEKTFLNRVKNFMMQMMLSCKQAAYLIDKKEYIDLSKKEKIDLKLHLTTCKYCRNYDKDSMFINIVISKAYDTSKLELKLSEKQKNRMLEKLKLNEG